MKLKNLPFSLNLSEELVELEKTGALALVNLANAAAKSFLVNEILTHTPFRNILWISEDERADALKANAEMFFEGDIFVIPNELSPSQFYDIRKSFTQKHPTMVFFEDLESLGKQVFPIESTLEEESVRLKISEKVQIFDVFSHLEQMGYNPAEDPRLKPGEFVRRGENLFVFPANEKECVRIDLFGDVIERIDFIDQDAGKVISALKEIQILPAQFSDQGRPFFDVFSDPLTLTILDDTEEDINRNGARVRFTTFPRDTERFFHLNFFSVLPYYTIPDFIVDIKERFRREFDIALITKRYDEVEKLFRENDVMFTEDLNDKMPSTVKIIRLEKDEFMPHSFQNNERKMLFLTDREIFQFHRSRRQKKSIAGVNFDLINSLKTGDYVTHVDHGIAQFEGIVRRDLGEHLGIREYLKLRYAQNDRLYVPVESAEKVTKFIGEDEPKLTRLGAADWKTSQRKLKVEAERIAKDLLKLYAARELAKGKKFIDNQDEMIAQFCASFPYELTPGQATAWIDVSRDMEEARPMDRLVCGDVGFGKTEIAMRAAFKCFRSGMQAVLLAPITILAEQHYQSFVKRTMGKKYGINIALLSRFQTAADQTKILRGLENGTVDVVIGTHRLLSEDIKFKNLGVIIVDEEQRFGVKQKEKLKQMRAGVDVLTMTATPIPRTLNMGLNKLKDISTITTPPPGRLPVVTEVRKYNLNLVRERIMFEMGRGGQVYFLHNEVKSIEGQAMQLRSLIPEARFIVAHGQLKPEELEARIHRFKEGEADVLIASTIIENGIDLSNANTLFVNRAEKFGLSQLYQLRGRVGRSRTQAYSYFLYHGQKLDVEARKRLRAIVEASELGAGFQIAMRDLEIRGAGEVLGASQSGAMKNVGIAYFMRMLAKTVDEMKSGEISTEVEEEQSITVEIPLSAYIAVGFIPDENEKLRTYQELASAQTHEDLSELRNELKEDYGHFPPPVENLFKVLSMKMLLRDANMEGIKVQKISHKSYEVVLRMGKNFSPTQVFRLMQNSKQKWVITANALKLSFESLPVTWYEDLVKEVKFLIPEKKGKSK